MKQILFIFLLFYTTFAYSAQLCYVSREDVQKVYDNVEYPDSTFNGDNFITLNYESGLKIRFMALAANNSTINTLDFVSNIEHENITGDQTSCYCRMIQPFVSKWQLVYKYTSEITGYSCSSVCDQNIFEYTLQYFDNLIDAKYQNLSSEYTIANPTCPDGNILIKKISVIEKDNCTIPLTKNIPANTTCTDASGTYTYTSECQVSYNVNLDANNCPAKPENPEN